MAGGNDNLAVSSLGLAKGKMFRSRKLDFSKPLAVYREEDIDLDENMAGMIRPVPVVATGVDKEEEEEKHLKAILESTSTSSSAHASIPIPEAVQSIISHYEEIYPPFYRLPKDFYRVPTSQRNAQFGVGVMSANSLVGFKFGAKTPLSVLLAKSSLKKTTINSGATLIVPYCLTSEDFLFLKSFNDDLTGSGDVLFSEDLLEEIIWIIESASNYYGFFDVNDELIMEYAQKWMRKDRYNLFENLKDKILSYWRNIKSGINGIPLIPTLRIEDEAPGPQIDPYVCFRKREVRILRKTRRSDTLSYQKLIQLREQFSTLMELCNLNIDRDTKKQEMVFLDSNIFISTYELEEWRLKYGVHVSIGDPSSVRASLKIPKMYSGNSSNMPKISSQSLKRKEPRAILRLPRKRALSEDTTVDSESVFDRSSRKTSKKLSFPGRLYGSTKSYRDLRRHYSHSNAGQNAKMPSYLLSPASPPLLGNLPSNSLNDTSQISASANVGLNVNSIPPAFSSCAPWSQFFHPIEVARYMDRELEKRVANESKRSYSIDIIKIGCNSSFLPFSSYEEEEEKYFFPVNSLTSSLPDENNKGHGRPLSMRVRRGRGGRLLIDRKPLQDITEKEVIPSPFILNSTGFRNKSLEFPSERLSSALKRPCIDIKDMELLSWNDLVLLNCSSIMNYNQHYVHSTGGRSLSSTGGILGNWSLATRMIGFNSHHTSSNIYNSSNMPNSTPLFYSSTPPMHHISSNANPNGPVPFNLASQTLPPYMSAYHPPPSSNSTDIKKGTQPSDGMSPTTNPLSTPASKKSRKLSANSSSEQNEPKKKKMSKKKKEEKELPPSNLSHSTPTSLSDMFSFSHPMNPSDTSYSKVPNNSNPFPNFTSLTQLSQSSSQGEFSHSSSIHSSKSSQLHSGSSITYHSSLQSTPIKPSTQAMTDTLQNNISMRRSPPQITVKVRPRSQLTSFSGQHIQGNSSTSNSDQSSSLQDKVLELSTSEARTNDLSFEGKNSNSNHHDRSSQRPTFSGKSPVHHRSNMTNVSGPGPGPASTHSAVNRKASSVNGSRSSSPTSSSPISSSSMSSLFPQPVSITLSTNSSSSNSPLTSPNSNTPRRSTRSRS